MLTGYVIPNKQFHIDNYNIFGRDRNKNNGDLMFYVNRDFNCKQLNTVVFFKRLKYF